MSYNDTLNESYESSESSESNVGLWLSIGSTVLAIIIIIIIIVLVIVLVKKNAETSSEEREYQQENQQIHQQEQDLANIVGNYDEESSSRISSEDSNRDIIQNLNQDIRQESDQNTSQESNQTPVIDPGETLAKTLDNKFVSLKSGNGGKYCSDTTSGITCETSGLTFAEKFKVKDLGSGIIALTGGRSQKFCSWDGNKMICESDSITNKEMFKMAHYSDSGNYISLRTPTTNNYCTYSGNYNPMVCNVEAPGVNEELRFEIQEQLCGDFSGQNVNCPTNPNNIFQILDGKKNPYTSRAAFESMGGTMNNIMGINCDILNACPIGDELKGSLQYQATKCQEEGKSWFAIEQKCLDQAATDAMVRQACLDKGDRWVNPYNLPGYGQCFKMS